MDLGALLLGLLTALVVKIAVIALTALLVVRLLKVSHTSTGKLWLLIPTEQRPRFRILTWGLILFGVSELCCGMEIYVLTHSHPVPACLHSLASAAAMGLTAVGLFQLLDWKYLHLVDTSAPCLAAKTCHSCTKRQGGACPYGPALGLFAGLLILISVPVYFAPTESMHAVPGRYVLPFPSLNERYDEMVATLREKKPDARRPDVSAYYLPEEMLLLEFRILPAAGALLAAASIACFAVRKENAGLGLLMFATGSLGYVYFEAMIYGLTGMPILGFFLHESGEVLFLLVLANVLPRMFPKRALQHCDNADQLAG